MLTYGVSFTNFGPYHLARLRALGVRLGELGGRLIAYEIAGNERRYPWQVTKDTEPFEWVTLFPDESVENLARSACAQAIGEALERDQPDAVGITGYARPESTAAIAWANRQGRPVILMSETQAIDHPRMWWKEAAKRRRVKRCSAALVGGPRHRDYLVTLGMPAERIAFGYNAVDNEAFALQATAARSSRATCAGLPDAPYFIAVNRLVSEKNLHRLVRAFAAYRGAASEPWDLVLGGDGPDAARLDRVIQASGVASSIHRPGFLQADDVARWLAHASGFVHPSLMEPWGLVVNEAAACGLPLLVSDRAGCAETLVPDPRGTTGCRFDPRDEDAIVASLAWLAALPADERHAMGRRAAQLVAEWGPDRFASGTLEALALAARPVSALPAAGCAAF
jgi:glycosyltransferase involved in cell wall biosynthesis